MVGSSSTTSTVPRGASLTPPIVPPPLGTCRFSAAHMGTELEARLAKREGIALDPLFRRQPQAALFDLGQVDQVVEALSVDHDGAVLHVLAGEPGGDRLAVEQHPHPPAAAGRAEHEVDAAGAEVELERTARRVY